MGDDGIFGGKPEAGPTLYRISADDPYGEDDATYSRLDFPSWSQTPVEIAGVYRCVVTDGSGNRYIVGGVSLAPDQFGAY